MRKFTLFSIALLSLGSAFAQIEKGTFTDARDGNVYKTEKIGNQVWMAENLRYMPKISIVNSNTDNTQPVYWVFGSKNTDINAAKKMMYYKKYGTLYNRKASQTACPKGWRLPTIADFKKLKASVKKLAKARNDDIHYFRWVECIRSKTDWDSNIPGLNWCFNALPSGRLSSGSYVEDIKVGRYTAWWTSSTTGGGDYSRAYIFLLFSNEYQITEEQRNYGLNCIRCIKESGEKPKVILKYPKNGNVEKLSNDKILLHFSWHGTDPNGQKLTYSLYFGEKENELELIGEGDVLDNSEISFKIDFEGKRVKRIYYWKIGAVNSSGVKVESPVWHFTLDNAVRMY